MNWLRAFWKALTTPMPATAATNESASRAPLTSERAGVSSSSGGDGLGNFTPRAQQALKLACEEAERLHHNFVGTEHLLLGIIKQNVGVAVNVLTALGIDLQKLRDEVEKQVGPGMGQKVVGNVPYTPRVKKALALAAKEAKALYHLYVGTEHILLGLLREGDGVAARVLASQGLTVEVVRQHVLRELDPNYLPDPTAPAPIVVRGEPEPAARRVEPVDTGKRYDIVCCEGEREVVFRNVRFKGVRTLLQQREDDSLTDYVELEQANGETVFIARWHLLRFTEHGAKAAEDGGGSGA